MEGRGASSCKVELGACIFSDIEERLQIIEAAVIREHKGNFFAAFFSLLKLQWF